MSVVTRDVEDSGSFDFEDPSKGEFTPEVTVISRRQARKMYALMFGGICIVVLLFTTSPFWAGKTSEDLTISNDDESSPVDQAQKQMDLPHDLEDMEEQVMGAETFVDENEKVPNKQSQGAVNEGVKTENIVKSNNKTKEIAKQAESGNATVKQEAADQLVEQSQLLHDLMKESQSLKVAWLMSFGGSGTSYTINNIERMTQTTTATNYGRDLHPAVPIKQNWTNGPFLHMPLRKPLPPTYILTKTHCGGYCMDCAPSAYMLEFDDFEQACRTGTKPNPAFGTSKNASKFLDVTYTRHIPQKAVHLIRNPFDNLVSRMHLGVKRQNRGRDEAENDSKKDPVSHFSNSKEGFDNWCLSLDEKHLEQERHSSLVNKTWLSTYSSLPCHSEWFKYVQWHNRASQVQDKLGMPVYILYYDDYFNETYDTTMDWLLDFLEFNTSQVHGETIDFIPSTYTDYFEPAHIRMAAYLVKETALPEVWKLIWDYFPRWVWEEDEETAKEEEEETPVTETEEEAETGVVIEETYHEVAWLMSFPNSGTSYTITNTEWISKASTASNYAADYVEYKAVRPDLQENGPFLHNLELRTPHTVLTKTHCVGYCDDCGPRAYRFDADGFLHGCLSGFKHDEDGTKVETTYEASVVAKAVHLIRSPFDNIVSRSHLAYNRRARSGSEWTEEQLASIETLEGWCQYVDKKWSAQDEVSALHLSPAQMQLLAKVPCHAEWYRYIQWHNLALNVTAQLDIPVHVLHYEDYSTDYNGTVTDLLDFLGLEWENDYALEFEATNHSYMDDFDDEQQDDAKALVQEFASPGLWQLLEHYFA